MSFNLYINLCSSLALRDSTTQTQNNQNHPHQHHVPRQSQPCRAARVYTATAFRGRASLTFAFPQQWGYPHIGDRYWDPFWAEAQAAGLSVNLHIGSGGSMGIAMNAPPDQHQLINLAQRSTGATQTGRADV